MRPASPKLLISQYKKGLKNKEVEEREGGRKHRTHWKIRGPPQEALLLDLKTHRTCAVPAPYNHRLTVL